MEFKKLLNDTDCNVIENTFTDIENEYLRKLRKDKLTDLDFISHWERGIGNTETECEKIIKYKGISINKNSKSVEHFIIEKYKTTFSINPRKGAYLLKFKLKTDAGLVAETPSKDDETHHDFFKSDDFNLNKLTIIKIIKFA